MADLLVLVREALQAFMGMPPILAAVWLGLLAHLVIKYSLICCADEEARHD